MNIAGVRVNSFVDYDSLISYVIFTGGCNMDCWYCHNRAILGAVEKLDEREVLKDIAKRVGFIDAVVISGGEATLQYDLKDFIRELKGFGLKIKLDTNGAKPKVIEDLLDSKLIDYIAMDIKAPFDKYKSITGVDIDTDIIAKSIDLLRNSNIDYEFRTTFSPDLSLTDIERIAMSISGARLYALQQFVNYDFLPKRVFGAHSPEYIKKAAEIANGYVKTIIRGV